MLRKSDVVFECYLTNKDYLRLKNKLIDIIDPQKDQVRLYRIPEPIKEHVEHYGIIDALDLRDPLVF